MYFGACMVIIFEFLMHILIASNSEIIAELMMIEL